MMYVLLYAQVKISRWTAWSWKEQSAVNEAALTGESIPVDKAQGDPGFGGNGQPVWLSTL